MYFRWRLLFYPSLDVFCTLKDENVENEMQAGHNITDEDLVLLQLKKLKQWQYFKY